MKCKKVSIEKNQLYLLNIYDDIEYYKDYFSLLEVTNYCNQKGIRIFRYGYQDNSFNIDTTGRSLLGLYVCHNNLIIEIAFLRLAIF